MRLSDHSGSSRSTELFDCSSQPVSAAGRDSAFFQLPSIDPAGHSRVPKAMQFVLSQPRGMFALMMCPGLAGAQAWLGLRHSALMPTDDEPAVAAGWGGLIQAVATRQDQTAFVKLFEHFAPRVKTFMLRSGAREATAEEIAQETMLSVWRKADSFVPGSTGAAAWIFTIARNLRIDALRREKWESPAELDIEKEDAVEPQIDERLTPESQISALQLEQCALATS